MPVKMLNGHGTKGVDTMLLSSHDMVFGLPKFDKAKLCSDCVVVKKIRKSFPQSSTFIASRTLELPHGDLCGPIEPSTLGNNDFFFPIMNSFF